MNKVMVWDLPTRCFHWLLVAGFTGATVTGDSEWWRDYHLLFGYTLAGLIVFRLVWGFVGTRYARFSSFRFCGRQVAVYLRSLVKKPIAHHTGHNPAGSWVIYILLLLAAIASVTGVLMVNDIGADPVEIIHELSSTVMLWTVGLHIAGALVSSFLHRENLLLAMITGRKRSVHCAGIANTRLPVALCLLLAVLVFWVVALA